jgi:alcohol dehydrogenase class IV
MTQIGYLTRTHFAEAAIEDALPVETGVAASALAVVDAEPGATAALARVRGALPRVSVTVSAVPADAPTAAVATRLAETIASGGFALVLAVGGGAAVAQARLAVERSARRGLPTRLIAVPVGLFDPGLARTVRHDLGELTACPRPDCIIADPTVLAGARPRRLAAAGMEMLVHAIEAYASPAWNPPADGLALEAVRRLSRWLPAAAGAPRDADARRELMAGTLTAALALEKAVGGVDALAHALESGRSGRAAPGDLHAPILAAIAGFNACAVGDRYGALAAAMAGDSAGDSIGPALSRIAGSLGLPRCLREAGIDRARLESLAPLAANDPGAQANPRRLSASDCRLILESAW